MLIAALKAGNLNFSTVLSAWTNDNVKGSNAIRDLNSSSNLFTYAPRDFREIAE
ncbi:hypothetical protein E4U40_002901 [Claviceps sp. LM458 group G5]|nr:hypothetical protein E4U40_002901 [Claviceps sp. LM458 group G5]